jgi:hypothetical protein
MKSSAEEHTEPVAWITCPACLNRVDFYIGQKEWSGYGLHYYIAAIHNDENVGRYHLIGDAAQESVATLAEGFCWRISRYSGQAQERGCEDVWNQARDTLRKLQAM